MKRSAIVFISLALLILSSPTVSSASGKEEDRKNEFFAPSSGIFSPSQDASSVSSSTEAPSLLRQIGTDFHNVFTTKENLVIIGTGLGAALAASSYDEQIRTSGFNSELFEDTQLDHVFEAGEIMGGALVQVGGAFATFGLGKLVNNSGLESLGRDLVRAQVLTQTITQAVKFGVGRTRPDGSSSTSFPSGHSAGTFATATVLQRRYGWKVGIPAYGVAAYIAASRLNENKHYLSDVLFGAAIGIMGGRTVTIGRGRVRFALSPMIPAGGGAGVQATLLPQDRD
jgi:membrane-associated phospholipid phosphatase